MEKCCDNPWATKRIKNYIWPNLISLYRFTTKGIPMQYTGPMEKQLDHRSFTETSLGFESY